MLAALIFNANVGRHGLFVALVPTLSAALWRRLTAFWLGACLAGRHGRLPKQSCCLLFLSQSAKAQLVRPSRELHHGTDVICQLAWLNANAEPNHCACTGGEDGIVRLFDLRDGQEVASFQAADDAVNGVHFNPHLPLMATASGKYFNHLRPLLSL